MMFIAENLCNFTVRNTGNNDNSVSSLAVNFNQVLCDQSWDLNYATVRAQPRHSLNLVFVDISD